MSETKSPERSCWDDIDEYYMQRVDVEKLRENLRLTMHERFEKHDREARARQMQEEKELMEWEREFDAF
jgi:hypothetical protein